MKSSVLQTFWDSVTV